MSDQLQCMYTRVQCRESLSHLLSLSQSLSICISLSVCVCAFAHLALSSSICVAMSSSFLTLLAIINTPFCVWVWVCFCKESKAHKHMHARTHSESKRDTQHTRRRKKHHTNKRPNKYVNVWDNYSHTRALLRSFPLSPPFVLLLLNISLFALTLWTNWWPYCGWERENRTKVKMKFLRHTIWCVVFEPSLRFELRKLFKWKSSENHIWNSNANMEKTSSKQARK